VGAPSSTQGRLGLSNQFARRGELVIAFASEGNTYVDRFVWAKDAYEHPGFVYADEIRELMLEPARQTMVQGEARGGKGRR
jgi:hypothetical protein